MSAVWKAFLLCLVVSFAYAAPVFVVDTELGEPFETCSIKTPVTATEKSYNAVLVHRKPGEAPRKAAILYIHGFNDYFFQRELAARADSAGYEFFALDLHANGRAIIPGEQRGKLRNVPEYYAEMDSAVSIIRETTNLPVVLLGHSTGGLVVSLYAVDRENAKDFAAIVLNSPFLEFNFHPLLVKLALPFLSKYGDRKPDFSVPTSNKPFYGESLYKGARGEWDFDTTKKSFLSPTQDLGWVRAIHLAQFRLQKGRDILPPVLVMHGSCSVRGFDEWIDDIQNCDAVLNVEDIEKYGARLGKRVTDVAIEGGIHDLYLSKKPVREAAYKATFDFLNQVLESR